MPRRRMLARMVRMEVDHELGSRCCLYRLPEAEFKEHERILISDCAVIRTLFVVHHSNSDPSLLLELTSAVVCIQLLRGIFSFASTHRANSI